ncbi:DUF3011 domain-containing protein [Marilutibacter spongiae]|uniref:DUF3011 domain-containing protein n=1 Tax=Marilutibacter spongiae TaxID=2025720 RepID=A0A7W3TK18_9GAMM|nr:DUF3011 domain-containing protein [Lysobacter spongiae]MBB1059499.1 DUF3011 domain-containing protein [Lysobacter spongiae]
MAAWSTGALADYRVTCESRDNGYRTCPLEQAGYVTMERRLSNSGCIKGRDWDYDRREIWVDDGCRAQFEVHTYGSSHYRSGSCDRDRDDRSSHHDAKVAAGVLVGAAILGAMVHNANKDEERYQDQGYQGARHASYVPSWMVGTFNGYNPVHHVNVRMTVQSDGRVTALAAGQTLNGWINGGQLHVGSDVFTINQSHDGFVTSQVGDHHNQVRYVRAR